MWSILLAFCAFWAMTHAADSRYQINNFNAPTHQAYLIKPVRPIVLQQPHRYLAPEEHIPFDLNNLAENSAGLSQPVPLNKSIKAKSKQVHKPRTKIPKKPLVTKSFYIHTAPEETEDEVRAELKQLEERPRKHFNVLFVKTPAQTSKIAALNYAKAVKGDQKTVVYVLSKKTTASDIRDVIEEGPQEINKPDVYFIKYRTPEEAEHAQQNIQSQYEALEGPSTISDEGEAPLTSVIGALDPVDEEKEEDEDEDEDTEVPATEKAAQISKHSNRNHDTFYGQPYIPPNRF